MLRSFMTFFALVVAATTASANDGRANPPRVLETVPANGTTVEGVSSDYAVRFDQPVDHLHSVLLIKRDGAVVETLTPRFKTAPDVLFARAPTLKPGNYSFHWQVRSLSGVTQLEGEIAFSVKAPGD